MPGFRNGTIYGDNVDFTGNTIASPQVLSNGQLLIGSESAPHIQVGTLTPGAGVTITNGPGSITIGLSGGGVGIDSIAVQTGTSPVTPTGAGLVTLNGAVTAAGTNPVRTDGTGANTVAVEVQTSQAIAATDATKIGLSAFNSAHFTVDASGFTSIGTVPVANGGTGSTGITGVVCGTGTAYNGRTLAAGTGISISNTQGIAGNPGFNVTGGGVTWNTVTGTSQTLNTGNGYFANNASRIDFNLGGLSSGDYFRVVGVGSGGWRVNANGGSKIIRILSSACTAGTGYIESTTQYDCVEIVAFSSTLVFVISSMGNITVV